MPSNGDYEFSVEALRHKAEYWAGRRRAAEAADRGDLIARAEAFEQAARVRAAQRETRGSAAEMVRMERERVEELRHSAREQLRSLREDPAYDLYRDWARRMDAGTVYDADAWRRTGRLVAVTDRMRYTAGGRARRETVDWTDVLDRQAQERGLEVLDLPRRFEQLRRRELAGQAAAREADRERREAAIFARELRGR